MGCIHNCVFYLGYRHLIVFLLFLSISSLTRVKFMAEGEKPVLHLIASPDFSYIVEENSIYSFVQIQMGREEKLVMVRRNMIGSRPPRCDRRCSSCGGQCEAIQVPISPQFKRSHGDHYYASATPTLAYFRGDGISNYKPMCWKCKCGDFIFNP
ncbi:hypothetical protein RJ640_005999 [Escallonia rubra]|uniref:Epidermal patterning factor-like protein n=1 Tax=Escallonia rubra TaxID=112253 RepID=A0AA88R5S1_9ASTE|nr:hypothetical protein RJ640_005999 [Escallonia rubra]